MTSKQVPTEQPNRKPVGNDKLVENIKRMPGIGLSFDDSNIFET